MKAMKIRDINFLRFLTLKLPLGQVDMFGGALFNPVPGTVMGKHIDRFFQRGYRSYSPAFSLYFHIPFCLKRCLYCWCERKAVAQKAEMQAYYQYLLGMIDAYAPHARGVPVDICNFGGGTPSLLSAAQITGLLGSIRRSFAVREKAYFMFEGSPRTLTLDKLKALKEGGVSRISLGVQTLNKKVLNAVDRLQSREEVERCIDNIRSLSFDFLNIDVMAGLPLQTEASFLADLRFLIARKPEVIHLHPFWNIQPSPYYQMKKGDIAAFFKGRHTMTRKGREMLLSGGYLRRGHEAFQMVSGGEKEQSVLYERSVGATLGIGAYAISTFPGQAVMQCLPRSGKDMTDNEYFGYAYPKHAVMANFIILNILSGIQRKDFQRIFGESLEGVFGAGLKRLEHLGLVAWQDGRLVYPGTRSFRALFDLFAWIKILYDDALLEKLQANFSREYHSSVDYSQERFMLKIMDNGWFVQAVYDLGV